jgi:hypothetical protein
MTISKITEYNNELYRLTLIKHTEQHHAELIQHDRKVKQIREDDEAKRIEMNRRLNRPGQNVDRMA